MARTKGQTVALIPARGGSKGIPKKNIRNLVGHPLIEYSIKAARLSPWIDRVIVSTDSDEVAKVALALGAEVPFLRPKELATDEAPGIAPVIHCLEMINEIETLILLQPTSPLRAVEDIEGCLNLYRNSGASVVSVTESPKHPAWMYSLSEDQALIKFDESFGQRRQDLAKIYYLNGAIYVASGKQLLKEKSFINSLTKGFVMPPDRSIDIDTFLDWEFTEFLLIRAKT